MLASRNTEKEFLKGWNKFADRLLINCHFYIKHWIKVLINYKFHFIDIELKEHCMLRQLLNLVLGIELYQSETDD